MNVLELMKKEKKLDFVYEQMENNFKSTTLQNKIIYELEDFLNKINIPENWFPELSEIDFYDPEYPPTATLDFFNPLNNLVLSVLLELDISKVYIGDTLYTFEVTLFVKEINIYSNNTIITLEVGYNHKVDINGIIEKYDELKRIFENIVE